MATITSLGVGSGLNLNTIVEQLTALERRPLTQMRSDANRLQTQVSSFGQIKSLFGSLQDASNTLNRNTLWSSTVASSADDKTVGATGNNGAAAGRYAVQVEQLARSQTLATATAYSSASAKVGSGTLELGLGAWSAQTGEFTPKLDSTATQIAVTDDDTVQTLRDKINSAGVGVTASLVTDSTGVRLSLRATATGVDNGFRLSATGASGGLEGLAYDPPNGASNLNLVQAAADAKASVNGIAVVSASNDLTGVIDGLTLRLRQLSTTPVEVTVSSDTEAVTKAIKTFADAYNALATYINDQTKYDAASRRGGPLQGDTSANSLMSQLRGVLNTPSAASTAFSRLSDVGLRAQRDGTLQVDSAKLSSAVGRLDELKKAFTNSDPATPSQNGFSRRYAALASGVLAVDGNLAIRTEGLRKLITRNESDQARVSDRAERFQARLVEQYTALDANVARLNSLNSYVTQQMTALNRSSSSR